MTQANIRPLGEITRANWIRLRTMIILRWVAIAGQLIATSFAPVIYSLDIELGPCYLVIGTAAIFNLIAGFIFPENKRLKEVEHLAMILFDLLQLSVLLYLTGGLNNPFAILMLGPVTISAAALTLRSTVVVGGLAIASITLLSLFYIPLQTKSGELIQTPEIFMTGLWIGLIIAVLFTSAYSRQVTSEMHSMADALAATQMALAREQKLTDLGGMVAAAAHELGTPLATIKLTSTELARDLKNNPDAIEDVQLIREQADRCRRILHDMGRPSKEGGHVRQAPLMAVIEHAAQPHMDRGKDVVFRIADGAPADQPTILQKPEIVHGLRNLIQNAVDFADHHVWVEGRFNQESIVVRILDDGRGFPLQLLGRIGDPFMRRRRRPSANTRRPEYEGMGLGLFIAKTLLERTGAELSFANGTDEGGQRNRKIGAVVEVRWPRASIEAKDAGAFESLAEAPPLTA